MRWVFATAVFAAGAIAGCPDPAFRCSSSSECAGNGAEGFCEPTGYCSFTDPDCDSGRRYSELAGEGLAFECVMPDGATSGSGTGDASGTAGGLSSASSAGDNPITATTTGVDETSDGNLDVSTTYPGDTSTGLTGAVSSSSDGGPTEATMSFGERPNADVQGVTQDTYLNEFVPLGNGGTRNDCHTESDGATRQTCLLRFDLSALGRRTVIGATLHLVNDDEVSDTLITLHALNEPWDEGMFDNEPGIPNWTERAVGVNWSTPGALGGAHDPQVMGSFMLDKVFGEYAVELETAVVQGWVNDSDTNYGILFQPAASSPVTFFASSEYAVEESRPMLVVTYLE